MSAPYHRISPSELALFLDDVGKNISSDEDTDFKKLALYLFGFADAKLHLLQQNGDSETLELLNRLLAAIELVLSKKKHILNLELEREDLVQVVHGTSTLIPDFPVIMYEWALHFAMSWLPQFPNSLEVTNSVKSFLIEIINIVAVHLHAFKYRKHLRTMLVALLESDIAKLFEYLPSIHLKEDFTAIYAPRLSSTVHLFTIVNDYDLSNKLLLNTASIQLKFGAIAKKLAFVFASIDFGALNLDANDPSFKLVDNLRSILILNMTCNVLLDSNVKWSQVSLVLKWIHDHFELFQKNTPHNIYLKNFNKATCSCLMKIYIFCRDQNLLSNFFNAFQLHMFCIVEEPNPSRPPSVSTLLGESKFPPSVSKLLHILTYQSHVLQGDLYQNVIDKFLLASVPFVDAELNDLRGEILTEKKVTPTSVLSFIIDTHYSLQRFRTQFPTEKSSELRIWLDYVVFLTLQDLRSPTLKLLSNTTTLYTLLSALRSVPCLIANDFDFEAGECTKCTKFSEKNIYAGISTTRKQISDLLESTILFSDIICGYLLRHKHNLIHDEPLLTSNLLLALFNLFSTFRPPNWDIETDVCFQFVLQCLTQNKNRDVRFLSARIIPLFLIQQQDDALESLFKYVFQHISTIKFDADGGAIHMAESTLMALSELAIVCEGEWLCVIFIKLIDSLGESNEQHVNIAYNCLLYIAAAKSLTPYKLLSPFLPSIAERIIKKPRMFSRIAELLGVSKKYFLSHTREYTTPRFLEYYKHDFIQEIAAASNMDKVKLIAKTLPRIMATYLCKDHPIDSKYIVNVLSNASPRYMNLTIAELIPNVGEVLWFILLQIQIDDNGKMHNEIKIFNAIQYVARINWMKKQPSGSTVSPPEKNEFDYIKYILGEHVLELVQRFSENVHHIKGIKPYLEKVSSLKAIQFLISKNIEAASSALGQISTCLQASLDNPALEVPAIQCWNVLVQNLGTQHLVSLFDITISLIFQKFGELEHRSKLIAVKILEKLFCELRDKYKKYALYYFSVPFIKDLDKYFVLDATFISMMKPKSKLSYFPEFTRRLQTNNKYVVHQALDDLMNFTNNYQQSCQGEDFRDPANADSISGLVRNLLDISVQFKSKDRTISTKCAKALASIGALDSNKFNFKTINSQIILLHDFQDYRENANFLCHFIKDKVIKNFWASNDPIKQLFSAYSMQKFLNVLGLDNSILGSSSQGIRAEVWNTFSDIDKSTLTPLLSSKYFAPDPRYEPLSFPFFRLGIKYEKWLVDFTTNLFRRPSESVFKQQGKAGLAKSIIFQTCSMLIRDEEVSISQYLLKYVALSHIVNGDEHGRKDILEEFLAILKTDSTQLTSSERLEQLKMCYQAVFEVIDHFNEWVSAATQKLSDVLFPKTEAAILKKSRGFVVSFLEQIPMELIAITSSECDSYERTILYLEKCYRDGKVQNNNKLDNLSITRTLQSVYSNIDDFDALDGILKKFSTNNLAEKLDTFQYNENWSIAQELFQVLSGVGSDTERIECNTKLLKSLANHALYDKVLSSLDSKIKNDTIGRLPMAWTMAGLQAAIVSGEIDQIRRWQTIAATIGTALDVEDLVNFKYAQGLLSLCDSKKDDFEVSMNEIYELIGQSLSLSMASSFSRNSSLMTQLHVIFDTSLIVSMGDDDDLTLQLDLEMILKERLNNTDLAFDSQWKILSMHKVASVITKNVNKVSDILLLCSEIARRNERFDISTRCIMNAMVLNDQEANIEYAHLLWDQGKQTEAIKTLSENLPKKKSVDIRKGVNTQLQYALWLDESSHSSSATIIAEYTKAYKFDPTWEKPYYDLGRYYSKVMESRNDLSGLYEQQIIRFYLKALALGPTYIFEALPKFITVWLDFAQRPHKNRDAERKLNQIIHDIQTYKNTIPVYVWYTSITQILSRITHLHESSVELMLRIIESLIRTYPKHSLWYVLSHVKSKDLKRRQGVTKILSSIQTDNSLGANIVNAKELFEILEGLAAQKVKKAQKKRWTLTEDFNIKDLKKSYDSLVIPVKSNLEIRLPATRHTSKPGAAFPKSASITFDGFDEEVNIFHSLQMPKQITIRGTDNRPYRLMVKRDDTRKDAKVFEFSNMINRLLSANNDARKRNLIIENYSVIPLAEDMGVIEFVQDVATMKSVIHDQQKKIGRIPHDRKLFMKLDEAQKVVKAKYSSDQTAMTALVTLFESICAEFPPVLHHWFIDQFSDPAVWYLARKSFTRTAAVMSMVGYIIGLGDRHCENILFFKRNGAALHIDFDCLFEKGTTLPTPEIVPFRLTQNMVDAMGITGIEGTFRITCEVTGQLLRENEASLMNILETLIYDPLLDWKTQENPQDHLRKVRRKIRGLLDEKEGLPMNIHGQVDVLIQEATSKENLCQMYGGWAPYV